MSAGVRPFSKPRLDGAVELRHLEVVAADERAHLARLHVHHHRGPLHLRELVELPRPHVRFRVLVDADVDHVAAAEHALHRFLLRPGERRRRQGDLLAVHARGDAALVDVHHDGGVELVGDEGVVAPARVFVRGRIDPLGHEVPRRLAKAAPAVPRPQAALDGQLRGLLDAEVERRVNLEAALVEVLDAELLVVLDVLPDLLGEVGADARRFLFVRAEDDRRVQCLLVLPAVDEALLEHAVEHVVAAPEGLVGMGDRRVRHRRADHPRDHGGLGDGQLLGVLAEVKPRGLLDAVGAVPEVDLIRIELEDLVLREILLDLDGQEGLVDLAAEALLRREEDLFGELLRQRRRPFDLLAGNDVLDRGAHERLRVDAAVIDEVGVLGGQDGLVEPRRDVALGHHDALLDRVLGEADAVAVVDAGDDRGLVILERLHLRHAHGVGEDEARGNAENEGGGEDEQARASHGRSL